MVLNTLAALALGVLSAPCAIADAQPGTGHWKSIDITGSSAVLAFVQAVAVPFGKSRGIGIHTRNTGSRAGIDCALEKTCQLGVTTFVVTEAEKKDLLATRLGWDGLVLIAHKDLPVDSLTTAQVRDIFTGKAKNWREVGGPDLAIHAMQRDRKRETRELFDKYFGVTPTVPEIEIGEALINHLKATPGSIGYFSMGVAETQKAGALKVIKLDGFLPTPESVASGKYKLTRELFLVRNRIWADDEVLSELTREIMDARKRLFQKYGYISD